MVDGFSYGCAQLCLVGLGWLFGALGVLQHVSRVSGKEDERTKDTCPISTESALGTGFSFLDDWASLLDIAGFSIALAVDVGYGTVKKRGKP